MDIKKPTLVSCLVLSLYASSAYAQCERYICAGVANTFLQALKSTEEGIYLNFPLGTAANLSCELKQGRYAKLDPATPSFNSMHSLLLTAITSNAPLAVEFSSTEQSCRVISVEILVTE
jgi:hypothetical protein